MRRLKQRAFYFVVLAVLFSLTLFLPWREAIAGGGADKKSGGKTLLTLGTGDPKGLYFYCGKRIEKIINLTSAKYSMACRPTNGALDNVSLVSEKALDFGFGQLDMLFRASSGAGEFSGVKHDELSVVTVLFPEVFTIVANDKINSIRDFNDRIVSIHLPGSGIFQNSSQLLDLAGLSNSVKKVNLNMGDTGKSFSEKKIDGFFSVIGMPAETITGALSNVSGSRVIGLAKDFQAKASGEMRGFVPYEIPVQTYSNDQPVPTIATFAVIFAGKNVSDECVKAFLETIYSLPDFSTNAGTRHGKVQYISKENAKKFLGGIKELKIHSAAQKFFGIEK